MANDALADVGLPPVGRVAAPLREQVIAAIRTAILDFQLRPGQRLIERELIDRFGVSRTTVREALRELVSEGLIAIVPQKGAVVASPSMAEALDLYDIRAHLETLAVERFVHRATEEQVDALEATVEELSRISRENPSDTVGLLHAKDRFYETIIDGAGSAVLSQLLSGLQARVRVLRATSLSSEGRAAESAEELRAVMRAVRARNAELAALLCAEHVRTAAKTAVARLEED